MTGGRRLLPEAMSADETGSDERVHFATNRVINAPGRRSDPSVPDRAAVPDAARAKVRARRRYFFVHAAYRLAARALNTEVEFATPFLFVPVLLGGGALLYFTAGFEPDWSALVLAAMIAAAGIRLGSSRPLASLVFWAGLLIVAGALAGKIETWRASTPMLGSAVTTTVNGTIAALEHQEGDRARITIDITSTAKPKLRYAPQRVRLVLRKPPNALKPGMKIAGRARLLPHAGPVHPRGFDFAFHNYFRGIGAVGFFLGQPRAWQDRARIGGLGLSTELERARGWLTARIKSRIDGPEGEIAAALITGAKAGIPEQVNETLRRTGLAHILSISGLHMALVAGTVMALLRFSFALFPEFASRHPVRKYAAAAALLTVFVYLFMSGAGIATQRSFLMLAVMLAALILDRPAITMRNLAIAAIIIILLQPHEVAGPSFQMSFAATAALVAVYTAWSTRRSRSAAATAKVDVSSGQLALWGRQLRFYVTTLAVTSLVAGAATAIFSVWHFQRLAPLGLFANLAAMPVVSLLVMPSAVLGVMAIPLDLDGPAFAVMGTGICLVVTIADWFSQRSPIDAVGMIPLASLLLASAGLIVLTLPATALRLLGVPFLVTAIIFAITRPPPMVLVDEHAKMIAVRRADDGLSLNTGKPRKFVLKIWLKASAAIAHFGPARHGEARLTEATVAAGAGEFVCDRALCAVQLPNGAVVAHAKNAGDARQACRFARLIVIQSATALPDICSTARVSNSSKAIILTARDLARKGAAAVSIATVARDSQVGSGRNGHRAYAIDIRHAISMPWRPWHAHRAYSREARGLAPIKRRKSKTAAANR